MSLDQNQVMKISCSVFLVTSLAFSAYGQQSEVRQIGSFQGVRASEAIDVYLKKGDKESVKVEATGTELSNVLTEVSGTSLKIHMRDGNYHGKKSVKVYVTFTRLDKISASSASNIFSEGSIKTGDMGINVSSAGSVEVTLDAESVTVDASSAGDAVLEGKAKSLEIEASSAGGIDAYNFDTEIVNVRVSSGGSAKISVSKELEAHASSGGSIRYRGNPLKTNTDSSSGGSVKKTN
jgi:hypothetical protein